MEQTFADKIVEIVRNALDSGVILPSDSKDSLINLLKEYDQRIEG